MKIKKIKQERPSLINIRQLDNFTTVTDQKLSLANDMVCLAINHKVSW